MTPACVQSKQAESCFAKSVASNADEYNRCLGVLERRLAGRDYILDDYSIADMASWPWVLIAKPLGQALDEFPNVARWREAVKQRPAVQRGVDLGKELRRSAPPSEAERRVLFNQTSRDVLRPPPQPPPPLRGEGGAPAAGG